ncbi:MAG: NAD-dependent epimerase/dehydratase family protein [Candidatus Dormibacteria bacterium]
MSVAIVTGSGGLIGSEAARAFAAFGFDIVGIDNDMRATFFGPEASTAWNVSDLRATLGTQYTHVSCDIRDIDVVKSVFRKYGSAVSLVIHTAAQPSHDWAANDPMTDFSVNAGGTLALLEATRHHCPEAVFIFTSTNKVYGDAPNRLPLVERELRWEIAEGHPYENGIPEELSIDNSLHSVFGASKVAADIMVQEYGRYFGMKTGVFRGGCLTGPRHAGTQLHGFLAYLMKCVVTGAPYTVFGYKGKQVRDNIHSADLIAAFWEFFKSPNSGQAYNMGGGRFSNCSMLEAVDLAQQVAGRELQWNYAEQNRVGDPIWWISDTSKFRRHYPQWTLKRDVPAILREIFEFGIERWSGADVDRAA